MAMRFMRSGPVTTMLGATIVLLAGCSIVSQPGTYPDPNGPRDGMGALIDPRTGVVLPGQPQGGGGHD